MGDGDEWNAIAARLASVPAAERWKSREVARLYALAVEVAPGLVGHLVDRARAKDLAGDLLIAKLDPLVEAQVPFPYFVQALKNATRSWLRRPASEVREDAQARPAGKQVPVGTAALELQAVLACLTPDEREIFASLEAGETTEAIAERFGKKVPALYKQISRARERLRNGGLL